MAVKGFVLESLDENCYSCRFGYYLVSVADERFTVAFVLFKMLLSLSNTCSSSIRHNELLVVEAIEMKESLCLAISSSGSCV